MTDTNLKINIVSDLTSFFEMLAKFDHEDKKRERSGIKIDSLVSTPKESILQSDLTNKTYGVEQTNQKNK